MVDRCVMKDSLSCDPSRINPRLQVEGDAAGITRGDCHHAPINHTVLLLCHGFIKFMYINKILMKTRL